MKKMKPKKPEAPFIPQYTSYCELKEDGTCELMDWMYRNTAPDHWETCKYYKEEEEDGI